MFKKRSLRVTLEKDNPQTQIESPLIAAINDMTPEQLNELQKKLMNQLAVRIGAIICAKVAVAIILAAIAKKLENPTK